MHAKLSQPDKASMKWYTTNPGPQCKLTIQLPIMSWLTMCSQSAQKQWKCVFIGYGAAMHKTNSDIIGGQAAKIGLIIGPSIFQHPIT